MVDTMVWFRIWWVFGEFGGGKVEGGGEFCNILAVNRPPPTTHIVRRGQFKAGFKKN
jgi:hypothetical protein